MIDTEGRAGLTRMVSRRARHVEIIHGASPSSGTGQRVSQQTERQGSRRRGRRSQQDMDGLRPASQRRRRDVESRRVQGWVRRAESGRPTAAADRALCRSSSAAIRYQDWKLDNSAGQVIDAVRLIRDAIRAPVEKLLGELLIADD